MALAILCAISLDVSQSLASAPETSLRPSQRVGSVSKPAPVNQIVELTAFAPSRSLRPLLRSFREAKPVNQTEQSIKKPKVFERLKRKKPVKRLKNPFSKRPKLGSVCGVSGIEGARIKPIKGRIKACGIAEAVRITAVDGVSLSQAATIDCPTAKALHSWVKETVKPAIKRKGGGVQSLKVAAHYACRTRNNRKGARISEHGKGRAIDISAINLKDGTSLTVLKDWRSRNSRIMRKIHKGACGPFGTVLGPKSDRYHQDHFHFDTARYRSGPYCR